MTAPVVTTPTATSTAPAPAPSGLVPAQPRPVATRRGPHRGSPTPTLLRWSRLLLVVVLLATMGGAGFFLLRSHDEAHGAHTDVLQYRRIASVRATMLQAHATATTGHLRQSGPTAAEQKELSEALARTNTLIMEAAIAQPQDRERLTSLMGLASNYAADVEAARAARETSPEGASARLVEADAVLMGKALPLLDDLEAVNASRMTSHAAVPPFAPAVSGAVAALALLGVSTLVARRSHRIVNVGLALALVGVLTTTTLTTGAIARTNGVVEQAKKVDIPAATSLAQAQRDLLEAKAADSLALLVPARKAEFASRATKALERGSASLAHAPAADRSGQLGSDLAAWRTAHDAVATGTPARALDIATSTQPTASTPTFGVLDTHLTEAFTKTTTTLAGSLSTGSNTLAGVAIGSALLLLASLVSALAGIGARLREYL